MPVSFSLRPDGIAAIIFDQPESKANVLSAAMWHALDAAAAEAAAQPGAKGILLASAKPGIFIAGADLKLLGEAGPGDPAVRDFIALGNTVLNRLEALPLPTMAVIDGAALGGGLEVALACDFRIVGSHAKAMLGLPEVNLGLIPGWGGTQRLPRIIGPEKAAELVSTGKSLNADEAVACGLALGKLPSEELLDAAAAMLLNMTAENRERARALKSGPVPAEARAAFQPPVPSEPPALRELMQVLIRGAALPFAEAMALETEAFLRLAGTEQSKEKIAAFFSRRK